jgi:hypothetical protein
MEIPEPTKARQLSYVNILARVLAKGAATERPVSQIGERL